MKNTPLDKQLIAALTQDEQNPQTIRELLEAGANAGMHYSDTGQCELLSRGGLTLHAETVEVLAMLIEHGADPFDAFDYAPDCPAHIIMIGESLLPVNDPEVMNQLRNTLPDFLAKWEAYTKRPLVIAA